MRKFISFAPSLENGYFCMRDTDEIGVYWYVVDLPWLHHPLCLRILKIWLKYYILVSKYASKSSIKLRHFWAENNNFKQKPLDFFPGSCVFENYWSPVLKWCREPALFKRLYNVDILSYAMDVNSCLNSKFLPRHLYVVAKASEPGENPAEILMVFFSIVYLHDAIVFWCQKLCHGSG